MRGISILAVLVGGVTDVVSSALLGIPFSIYVIASRHLAGLPRDQLSAVLLSTVHGSPGLFAIQLLIGGGCSVLGGFVAAVIAKRREMLNGVLASWLCVGIGVYSLVDGHAMGSLGLHVALVVMTPFFYALGANVRKRRSPANLAMA